MDGATVLGIEQRLFDVAVAVAVLLTCTLLLTRVAWQPVKRLWIIQCTLIGGLLLLAGLFLPKAIHIGLLKTSVSASHPEQSVERTFSPSANSPYIAAFPTSRRGTEAFTAHDENREDGSIAPSSGKSDRQPRVEARNPTQPQRAEAAASQVDVSWSRVILIVQVAGSLGMLCWLALGHWSLRRLVSRADLASDGLNDYWRQLQTNMQSQLSMSRRRTVRLLVSNNLDFPVAIGITKPAVLLPKWMVESYATEQLRPILAHELAHAMRRDATVRWIAAVFQVAFFYQPLYWWMRREMRLCQEYLADAVAATHASSSADYAEQLLSLLKSMHSRRWRPLPAVGINERRSEIYRRVSMIVQPPRSLELLCSRRWYLVTGITLLALTQLPGLMTLRAEDPKPQLLSDSTEQKSESDEVRGVQQTATPSAVTPSTVTPSDIAKPGAALRYRVTDRQGKAIAHAKVKPWGISLEDNRGSFWIGEIVSPTTTDESGVFSVDIPFGSNDPRHFVFSGVRPSDVQSLAVQIDHPDHPTWSQYFSAGTEDPIVLSDSVTVTVQAHRDEKGAVLNRLYPVLSAPATDWSQSDSSVTIRRVDLSGVRPSRWLRLAHVPVDGPALFSELVDLTSRKGNPISLELLMKPGVRVEGTLAKDVPRPVVNGRVVASTIHGTDPMGSWQWSATASIAEDGTFVLESMPVGETLQIIALCDGWVSSSPRANEIEDYSAKHGFEAKVDYALETTSVCPQLFWLEGPLLKPTIAMQPTGACEVTVLDPDGGPIPEANVSFFPNQVFDNVGSSIVGMGSDSVSIVRAELATGKPYTATSIDEHAKRYMATTDAHGIATVRNLPAGRADKVPAEQDLWFHVSCEGYVAIGNSALPMFAVAGPILAAKLSPGKTERITVRMRKAPGAHANVVPAEDDELAGRVVDAQGRPVADVQVLVYENDDNKIRTDKDGMFRHQVKAESGDEKHLFVRFKKPDYAPYLVIDWPLGLKDQVIVLDATTYFEGVVTRPDGEPAADVLIRANQGPKQDNPQGVIEELWSETRTDNEGRYKLLVQSDLYAIEVRAPGVGTARVPKPDEKGDDNEADTNLLPQPQRPKIAIGQGQAKHVNIQLSAGVDFRAQIVDMLTGKPVPNVRLWDWQHPGIEGRSDDNGLLSIPTMPEGEFRFMIEAPGYLRSWSSEIPERWKELISDSTNQITARPLMPNDEGLPFDLELGMPQVTIMLEPAVTISGRVLDPAGKPVGGATVAPVRTGKGRSLTGDTRYSVVSANEDGVFTMLLPPSENQKYNVMVHDGTYQEWRTWANGIGPVLNTTPGEKVEGVDIHLSRPGIIRGRIVNKQGEPVAGVYVQTSALDGLENNYYNPGTRSDEQGKFELRYVRPGQHRVHGWMMVSDTPEELAKFPPVDVVEGETTNIGDVYIAPRYQDRK